MTDVKAMRDFRDKYDANVAALLQQVQSGPPFACARGAASAGSRSPPAQFEEGEIRRLEEESGLLNHYMVRFRFRRATIELRALGADRAQQSCQERGAQRRGRRALRGTDESAPGHQHLRR